MRTSLRSPSSRDLAFDQAVAEAMRTPVTDALQPQDSPASDPAAGAPGPEGDATDRVAAVPAVLNAESDAGDRDRVEHERQARLRRWQAVDPRERRAD